MRQLNQKLQTLSDTIFSYSGTKLSTLNFSVQVQAHLQVMLDLCKISMDFGDVAPFKEI